MAATTSSSSAADDMDSWTCQVEENLLDLVFVCDCTGSMGTYIESAKENIVKIVEGIVSAEKCEVQFALIKYRDNPPQDNTFVTEIEPFTVSPSKMRGYVNTMSAQGGGDGPEAVADAMHAALNLDYRKGAAKVVVLIADAPPHGLEPTGDGFPNGSPNGHDPIKIAKEMAQRDIVVYTVLCEPGVGSFAYARDFFISVAKITGGEYLPLTSAHLLPQVVIGSAVELISLERVRDELEQQAHKAHQEALARGEALKEDDLADRMEKLLRERKTITNQVKFDQFYSSQYSMANSELLEKSPGLSDAKKSLKVHTESAYKDSKTLSTPQSYHCESAEVSRHQVEKMAKRTMWKHGYH